MVGGQRATIRWLARATDHRPLTTGASATRVESNLAFSGETDPMMPSTRTTLGWLLLVFGALVFICGVCSVSAPTLVGPSLGGGSNDGGGWFGDSSNSGGWGSDSGSDSGSWDSGGWDSGGSDSGSWDFGGSDSGSWDSGGFDSGGWDSGGSDSGSW